MPVTTTTSPICPQCARRATTVIRICATAAAAVPAKRSRGTSTPPMVTVALAGRRSPAISAASSTQRLTGTSIMVATRKMPLLSQLDQARFGDRAGEEGAAAAIETHQIVGDKVGTGCQEPGHQRRFAGARRRRERRMPRPHHAAADACSRSVAAGRSSGGARRPAGQQMRRPGADPASRRSRVQICGSRSSRAMRASAFSWAVLASSGASSRNTRSIGASSSAS